GARESLVGRARARGVARDSSGGVRHARCRARGGVARFGARIGIDARGGGGVGMSEARVIDHTNIALAKYWGKLPGDENLPAVPSLSVTLDAVATRTHVVFRDDLRADALVLNGEDADDASL